MDKSLIIKKFIMVHGNEYDYSLVDYTVNWFGGEDSLKKQIIKDSIKTEYCQDNKIILIRIKYDENIDLKLKHLS